ncbi:MAG: MFS transporter, partial [Candidatus Fimenecus sp.]
MQNTANKVKPFGMQDKIGYAMGDLGCNLSFQLVSSYMFLFYTQCIGLSSMHWAWIIIVSKVWDAINDVLIGGMVDRKRIGKKSKFMPWIR